MMQNKRGISAILVGFIVLSLMICGCVDSKASIIGKWEMVDTGTTMQFFKDGTIVRVSEDSMVTGDYMFVDDDHIRVEFGGAASIVGPIVFEVTFFEDTLVLTSPVGGLYEYRRV